MMRKRLFMGLCLLLLALRGEAQMEFDRYFMRKTLRIDFALSGNWETQRAAIQQLREEPVWAGPVKNRIDPFGYGGYEIRVYERSGDTLIYARGFNTLFEEWRTTEQAKTEVQSWTNSVCIPYPKEEVLIELLAREKADMAFHSLLRQRVDPASIFIDRSPLRKNQITRLQERGVPERKVDLVFVGEGYTADEQTKFSADAARFMESLFQTPPFDTCRDDFNVWAVNLVSEDSGTDVSGQGVFKNTALNTGYYTFGVSRYLTTADMKSIRDAVWEVPCDALFILVNTDTYGGGGIYNFYAMGTSDHPKTPVLFVHEFGHSFAGLADEYFSSEVAYQDFYNLEREPWEPNITTLVDFDRKWKDLLPEGMPVPTPLDERYKEHLGVFEGGGYLAKGIFRPMDHCMMRDYAPFCPACRRAILRMVDYYTDRAIR